MGVFTAGAALLYAPTNVVSPVRPPSDLVELSPAETPSNELSILFVGDMFFDRHIRLMAQKHGPLHPLSCVKELFADADGVVGNLEGPITTNASVSVGSIVGSANNFRFTFPTSTAAALAHYNVRAVSLGNNHILNFGYTGLEQTKRWLEKSGVGYFGGVVGDEPIYRIDEQDIKLSLIGFNTFGGSSAEIVAQRIASERAAGRLVVVMPHWGIEYSTSTKPMKAAAELFSKAGATLVVGAHPHVVGAREDIADTVVYYSLGNFLFDQYFTPAVRAGLAIRVTFKKEGIVLIREYQTRLERDGRVCPVVE